MKRKLSVIHLVKISWNWLIKLMFPTSNAAAVPVTMTTGNAGVVSISYPPSMSVGEERCDAAPEKQYSEYFSKSLFTRKLEEFKAGKLTLKYMTTYLDFMHISGFISNLDYLEYKPQLKED